MNDMRRFIATVTKRRTREWGSKKVNLNEIKRLEELERQNKISLGERRRLNMLRRLHH
ncbi:MAG: hypothetical protein AB1467_02620 [Candidatus Diapherotrites archaeon]